MTPSSLADLTEGQKQCLRLVHQLLTSKEIARHLGISHFTVDQRLASARRKLNAQSRKDAARIFIILEQQYPPTPFTDEPKHGDAPYDTHVDTPQPVGGRWHRRPRRGLVIRSLSMAFFSTFLMALIIVILNGALLLFR